MLRRMCGTLYVDYVRYATSGFSGSTAMLLTHAA